MKKREVTVVYTIEDEALFRSSGNPLRYDHNGLKSHTVAVGDVVVRHQELESTLLLIAALGFSDSRASILAKTALDAERRCIEETLK